MAQSSLTARIKSFGHAFAGIGFALRTQANFRLQTIAAATTIVLALMLQISAEDWRWVVFAIALVLVAEAVNTAIEHVCNVVQPELHASVKAAKDVAAGAVLMAAIAAFVLGVMIFLPYVLAYLPS